MITTFVEFDDLMAVVLYQWEYPNCRLIVDTDTNERYIDAGNIRVYLAGVNRKYDEVIYY